ncbi:MAG: tRNA 2-thiouridine(34) synthase MnmA [Arenimonas sp.]|nr:tRNA 2-thiouridine(34) synthase MnmA [Arenimonas sp.]MBP6626906.1 tRNA 2-thiouridine(34) synthase MnmA [Arenimonas sp.]
MSPARVIVGMSGGVDSSVAALLLQRHGESIAGLFMQNWNDDAAQDNGATPGEDAGASGCRAEDDRRDALGICGRLGIPFHARNFAAAYWSGVFEHFLAEYRAGRTPNPDVLCNREIKFKTFLEEARGLGAEKIATGHYAQVAQRDGRWALLRGADADKDQSYFLHQLGQDALSATLFPVGHLPKGEVRRLAREAGLPTAAKKDSTGICFIGERDFRDFLGRYLPAQPGEIRSVDGQAVGEHAGAWYYTLGQREGLQVGGVRGRPAAPWYVVAKDVASNVVYVDQGADSPWLMSGQLHTEAAHWISGEPPALGFRCTAKTRYRQADQACTVEWTRDGALSVRFDQPQRAVTPGQSLVLYRGDECLGGAVIAGTDAPSVSPNAKTRHA